MIPCGAAVRGWSTVRSFPHPGIAALAAFWCSGAAVAATAQTPPPPSPPPQAAAADPRAALDREVDAYIRGVTRNPGFSESDPLVRWNTPICLRVAGWTAEQVKAVSDRLAQIASSAGGPLAREPCQPDFVVVATAQPDDILDAWSSRNHQLFGDASTAEIRRFRESSESRPVRVWYNIDQGRKSGVRNGHFVPSNLRAESSPFLRNTAFDFISIFVIVDTRRTQHATLDQLAGYAAIVGLTNI